MSVVIRVLIADDEALMRAGVRLVLETATDVEVVGEAGDGPAAVAACRRLDVDVALLDVRMPGGDGITAAADIARLAPSTSTLILTTFDDDDAVVGALREGAVGFLLKDTGPTTLIQAVRAAALGQPVLAPQVLERLVTRRVTEPQRAREAKERIATLTPAERGVLDVLGEGLPNGEIARRLFISTGTTKAHISSILAKLGCENRTQAAIIAHESRL